MLHSLLLKDNLILLRYSGSSGGREGCTGGGRAGDLAYFSNGSPIISNDNKFC